MKAVIFDFNGTLFWDTELHNRAWDIFLKGKGKFMSDKEKERSLHGKNNRDIMQYIFPVIATEEIEQLVIEKESIYQRLVKDGNFTLAPGLTELLDFLKENKVLYTIATASGKFNVDFYFSHLKIGDYFDIREVIYDNGKIKGKPSPDMYVQAMATLHAKPENTIVFEDSYMGIEAAERAGASQIIIVDSNNQSYEKYNHSVITHFSEVDRSIFL